MQSACYSTCKWTMKKPTPVISKLGPCSNAHSVSVPSKQLQVRSLHILKRTLLPRSDSLMNEIINQVRGIFTSHIVWLLLVTAIFGLTGCGDTEEEVPLASQAT